MILTDNETKVDLLNNEAIARTIIELLRESVKRRSKGTPDRRRRGTPFSDNMMLVC